jgi:hypothetical protein
VRKSRSPPHLRTIMIVENSFTPKGAAKLELLSYKPASCHTGSQNKK